MDDQSNQRVKVDAIGLKRLFAGLSMQGVSIEYAALSVGTSSRTLRDWRRGKYTIPETKFLKLLELAGLSPEDIVSTKLQQWWYVTDAASKGGRAYMVKYSQLGNAESRKAGGVASYTRRKDIVQDIFHRKDIRTPELSCELAEFVGIMIGDGSIGAYQASIVLDAVTDSDYTQYVVSLATRLFGVQPMLQERKDRGCTVITLSSVALVHRLTLLGLPKGNKLKAGLDVPAWISDNENYATACIRGIFDTDGSVFQEVHKYKDRVYTYPRLMLVSMSPSLRQTVADLLNQLGVRAVIRGDRSVSIERFTDIEKYFRIVGSSNPKHLRRYAKFGEVG